MRLLAVYATIWLFVGCILATLIPGYDWWAYLWGGVLSVVAYAFGWMARGEDLRVKVEDLMLPKMRSAMTAYWGYDMALQRVLRLIDGKEGR